MNNVMSATDARVHFGEVMRRVSEHDEIVIVERGGSPRVAIISVEQLNRFRQGQQDKDNECGDWFDRTLRTHERIRRAIGNQQLPPAADVIREMREERDAQLLADLRGR